MKAKKKTAFIKVEYWDCGNDSHRHRSKPVADNCIKKNANKKPVCHKMARERHVHAARMVISGATYREASEAVSLSPARVRVAMQNILRMSIQPSKNPGEPPCSLWEIKEIREHKEYWLKRVNVIAKEWGVK